MKLIDFLSFQPFEKLRQDMDAPLVDPISEIVINGLDANEIRAIGLEGIDINSLDVLDIDDNGTLVYKNTRVILYIRDWSYSSSSNNQSMPKFHVSNCRTLQDMRLRGRGARYVIATREDGVFIVNKITNGLVEKGIQAKLDVCKNCLADLNWSDYSSGGDKNKIFNSFSLTDFFKKYPKSLLSQRTMLDDQEATFNHYVDDWNSISFELRQSKNWKCESCNTDMKDKKDKLDVHHKNGIKYDNNPSNLKVLCRTCHAKEPGHEHLHQ